MSSSLVKINVHIVFHVKNNRIRIKTEDLPRVFQYMGGIIRKTEGIPIAIGGVSDHIHILASLPKKMSIMDFVRTVKAISSKWIKGLNPYYKYFAWQDGYGAFSVSPSILNRTVYYIQNQQKHHEKKSARDEFRLLLIAYGIQYNEKQMIDL